MAGDVNPVLGSIEGKWLFILCDFKVSPLQEVIAQVFGMSRGRAMNGLINSGIAALGLHVI